MAKKKKKKKFEMPSLFGGLREETVHGIWAVFFFVLSIFFALSAFSSAGVVGEWTYKTFNGLFGVGYYLLPILFLMLAITYTGSLREHIGGLRAFGATLFFVSALALIDLVFERGGGFIGTKISGPLQSLFDKATIVILIALVVVSILILFDLRFSFAPLRKLGNLFSRKKEGDVDLKEFDDDEEEEYEDEDEEEYDEEEYEDEEYEDEEEEPKKKKGLNINIFGKKQDEEEDSGIRFVPSGDTYIPPPMSLLDKDTGKPDNGDVKASANIIKRTFLNFGIDVEMDEISLGPTITRFALRPAAGVRLTRITQLQKELELALAAKTVRIEAPIPGKPLVGIEVPNRSTATVRLGNMLNTPKFLNAPAPLTVALGRDIEGKIHYADLAAMPHALVAGTTGSGKSVMMHSLIMSLLFRNGPDQLKFILVDPKRVELTLYKDIPHLLTPVVTSSKKAILALKWAAKEMDRRYEVLEEYSKQNIDGYHSQILNPAIEQLDGTEDEDERSHLPETMPFIVIVIDELADLMSEYGKELEPSIVRIAQKARAVGIHLVLSTQRPSVNVITGNIKANIITRVALKVPTLIDSRTILDSSGAEKLLGKGDMLFMKGDSPKPVRIQSPFTSGDEVKKVVKYLLKKHADDVPNLVDFSEALEESNVLFADDNESDELYEQARMEVIQVGKASTSYLQRKLRVGYSRAARLMDELEKKGVIGPPDGSKPRPIIGDGEGGFDEEEEEEDLVLNPLPKGKKGELLVEEDEEDEEEDEEYEDEDEELEEEELEDEEYEDEDEEEEEYEDEDEEEEDEKKDGGELYSSR